MSDSHSLANDKAILVRRVLFFIALLALTFANLFPLFRGLNSPYAMDQAQIAREIARGNGPTTKFLRPIAISSAEKAMSGNVSFEGFRDTYHAPLNPLINAAILKIVGADKPNAWEMGPKERVFPLDRVIAATSTIFFLMAIGINYLLISRIFDAKIASTTAVLLLFCELLWRFSLSGLPQMLMLLLFSCGIYFAYRATESTKEGRVALAPALTAGFFFTLMVLTHWITLWIVLGYVIYAAIVFRPRGVVALAVIGMLALAVVFPLVQNARYSDSPLGIAYLVLYNGLGGTENTIMRTSEMSEAQLSLDGMFWKILRTTLLQGTDIIAFLGGLIVAPLFFVSLLHGFRRPSIATFRWGVLLMWVIAALGMSLFGVDSKGTHVNQIHILFAPIMAGYGIAFLSILWSRLDFPQSIPALKNAHLIGIVILSAAPLVLDMPQRIQLGLHIGEQGAPQWPPYYPTGLNTQLRSITSEKQIIVSDQPWAVAWYADRMSVWLPTKAKGFETLENRAAVLKTPFVGILASPSSTSIGTPWEIQSEYGPFTPIVMQGRMLIATQGTASIFDKNPETTGIARRYPYPVPLANYDLLYFSDRPMKSKEQQQPQQ